MSSPYLSEIRLMSFNFAPRGWALCNGQILGIQQNSALFALIGTYYGGNGVQTFALPNLQGRVPVHMGDGFGIGQVMGEVSHTLSLSEMPTHQHLMKASTTAGAETIPAPALALGKAEVSTSTAAPAATPVNIYGTGNTSAVFNAAAISNTGSGQPHPNQQPYLVSNYCISLSGIFPSRN